MTKQFLDNTDHVLLYDSQTLTDEEKLQARTNIGSNTLVVTKTSSDTAIELSPNTFYVFPEMASLSITFSDPISFDIVNEYKFRFISGATATTLTLPSTVVGDITIEVNKVYEISIVDNYLVYQSWAVS